MPEEEFFKKTLEVVKAAHKALPNAGIQNIIQRMEDGRWDALDALIWLKDVLPEQGVKLVDDLIQQQYPSN